MSIPINPYALAGWSNTLTPSEPSPTNSFINFRIMHPSAEAVGSTTAPIDILNCIVMDLHRRMRLSIRTGRTPASSTLVTMLCDPSGAVVGNIVWNTPHPIIECKNAVHIARQSSSAFFKAVSTSEFLLTLDGRQYNWVVGSHDQKIYSVATPQVAAELKAVVTREYTGELNIGIAPIGLQQGLLDGAVVALLLLCSGNPF